MKPKRILQPTEEEKRLAWRLASGQGDLIYAVTILVFILAILRSLLIRSHRPVRFWAGR